MLLWGQYVNVNLCCSQIDFFTFCESNMVLTQRYSFSKSWGSGKKPARAQQFLTLEHMTLLSTKFSIESNTVDLQNKIYKKNSALRMFMIYVLSPFRAIFCWMQLKKLMEERPRCSFSTPRVLAVAWHVLLSSCISETAARLSQWTHIKGNFQLINQLWTNRSSHPVSAAGAPLLPLQSRTEKAGLWSCSLLSQCGSYWDVSLACFPPSLSLSFHLSCMCMCRCMQFSPSTTLCGFQNETQVCLLDCL